MTGSGFDNYVQRNVYSPGQFNDVAEWRWFAKYAASAYELGLMIGDTDGNFNPRDNITVAEAIALAARLHNIYSGGEAQFLQAGRWYSIYIDYAIKNGIISKDSELLTDVKRPITREEMADVFVNALPGEALRPINTVSSLPDVSESDRYGDAIFELYRAGVLTGNDSEGTYAPTSNIIRAEVAALVTRLVRPEERVTLDY